MYSSLGCTLSAGVDVVNENAGSSLLRDVDDASLILSGTDLTRLRDEGKLTLHPANYRLVYRDASSSSEHGGAKYPG